MEILMKVDGNPEDRGDMFHRIVCSLPTDFTASYAREL
jgi:hypothetical protein